MAIYAFGSYPNAIEEGLGLKYSSVAKVPRQLAGHKTGKERDAAIVKMFQENPQAEDAELGWWFGQKQDNLHRILTQARKTGLALPERRRRKRALK